MKKDTLPRIWERYLEVVNTELIPSVRDLTEDTGNLWQTYADGAREIGAFLRSTRDISLGIIPPVIIDALSRMGLEQLDEKTGDSEIRHLLSNVKSIYEARGSNLYPLPNGANDEAGNVMGSIKMKLNQGRNKRGRSLW